MGSNNIRRVDLLNHVLFIKFVLILAILSRTMKTANLVLLILILFVLFAGCDKDKQAIRKDLNSRFTKFKIIDVIKDSSNVSDVMMTFKRLEIRIADNNRKIIKSLNDIKSGAASQKPYQTIFYIDSLYNNSIEGGMDLEIMQFDRSEACYYVNYLIYKEGMKVPKEEYFYISEGNPMYSALIPVSYTHLTLPTICSVQISVVAVSLKKKTRKKHEDAQRYDKLRSGRRN
eukprot:TRINITY_DN13619_c0_g1_i5.p1 TRINITY_DN13619_c0_g1~~TRINITY_DN13619_c0_g1_i5.p1  ORF type:complete len:230 (+),score=15.34 TRINITY_DN13619_c0_g1_i5:80-769(+)